jgi:NADH-quinone oxidoreductase subunit J
MFPELSAHLGPIYFYVFALTAVLCGAGLLIARHPIKGAICLIGVMLSLSGIYALLHSPFIAVLQVLVYAGAIMMLLVFVIMVLNKAEDHEVPRFDRLSIIGLAVPVIIALVVASVVANVPLAEDAATPYATIATLGTALFATGAGSGGWYLLFEAGGLLLLAAVVGAVLLAKRHLDTPIAGDEHLVAPTHGHGGHADRGTAIAMLHDQASGSTSTTLANAPDGKH